MKYYTLYKITNLLNDKYYIGVHVTDNLNDGYMGSGKRIKIAIAKYRLNNFKKEILFFCNSKEELLEKEKEIVNFEMLLDENCYNISLGGKGSWYHVDHKSGRKAADIILEEKLGKDFKTILALRGVETSKNNKLGIFNPNFINPFKSNKEIQQLGNAPESRAKAVITAKRTFEEIKHQQGETNSQFGTCWITKDNLNKKIQKDDLDYWLTQGWIKGRIIKRV